MFGGWGNIIWYEQHGCYNGVRSLVAKMKTQKC